MLRHMPLMLRRLLLPLRFFHCRFRCRRACLFAVCHYATYAATLMMMLPMLSLDDAMPAMRRRC